MIQITIFNYEAFYLDFLEGNLDQEESALLLDFLRNHPELVVDELPVYNAESVELDLSFLDTLKKVDIENDHLTSFNCESFIIAHFEDQLSTLKNEELLEFVKVDVKAKRLYENYKCVKMRADLTVLYPNKNELKRSRRIVLWPYISAAASILIIFGVYKFVSPTESGMNQIGLAANDFGYYLPQKFDFSINSDNGDIVLTSNIDEKKGKVEFVDNALPIDNDLTPKNYRIQVASISKRDVLLQEIDQEIKPNKTFPIYAINNSAENDVVFAANEMRNPIKPVTERLSEFTKTEIDLKTASAAQKGKKGFYFKIGNLEVEHKKH